MKQTAGKQFATRVAAETARIKKASMGSERRKADILSAFAEKEGPATPEQIAKMGDSYCPPKVSQKVNRPYATRKSALEALRSKSYHMSADHYAVLSDLRMWMLGAEKHLGLVSSYGQQRWDGTPASQMDIAKFAEVPLAIRCGQNVQEAEEVVGHKRQWEALVLVLKNDLNFRDVGVAMRVTGKRAGEIFWQGADKLLNHYRPRQRSDYLQTHPNPGIDNR